MVDSNIGGLLQPVKDAVTGGANTGATAAVSNGGHMGLIIGVIVGILILSIAGAFIYFFRIEKKQWNIITRVHYENPVINGVSFGNGIKTRRVRFKDGRVVYLYKTPIQGYTISPELLVWTRPREHDVVVTQDKKVFCIIGINSIDVQRKKLNVEISYPDIEMDRQDLQQFIDSKKYNDPNEKLKLIAKVSIWIFVLVSIIIVCVVGGKSYVNAKNVDLQRDQVNLQVSENQLKVMDSVNKFLEIMDKQGGVYSKNYYYNSTL